MTVVLPAVATRAKQVWDSTIQTYGRTVSLKPIEDGEPTLTGVKAFCTRPKILGLFDRTEQSFDQTRFVVQLRVQDIPETGIDKFDRVHWDGIDHAVMSVTEVVLSDIKIGYRLLVKG